MHGLIFETSIWLLAGSTRYLPSQVTIRCVNAQRLRALIESLQHHWPCPGRPFNGHVNHSSGTFILVELNCHSPSTIIIRRFCVITLTPDVTLHPKCNQVSLPHELPHLLIFPDEQALGFRLSKLWKFRDHVHPKMLEFFKCRAPLKRVCSSQQLKDLLAKMKLLVIHAQ